jgi:16S rRNA (cytosine967-C5)-methyltransferase
MTSRALAIRCLVAQQRGKDPVDQVFADQLRRHPLPDERDRQLAMALVYGVLRHGQELDTLLQAASKTKLAKLDPLVLQALRCGLFQLLFMDRVPASAAVNETVQALGRQPQWLKGFVNGVLRALARDLAGVRQRLAALAPEQRLNHPAWLVAQWHEQFGQQLCHDICLANNSLPPLSLRLNPRLVCRHDFLAELIARGIVAQPGAYAEHGVLLPDFHGPIDSLPGYAEGWFHVQDEAAQLIADFFADLPVGRYLDGCAGLGGKTLLLDQVLPPEAELVAVEPHEGRRRLLAENLARCRCRPVALHAATLADFAASTPPCFTGILLDAPCSGLGIIRRQPDIRWNRSPADLVSLAQNQLDLLTTAARLLCPGGVMVYVTCSLSPLENEGVIAAFLAAQPHFTLMPPQLSGPSSGLLTDQGFLRTLPSQGLDGFFAARLTRSAS